MKNRVYVLGLLVVATAFFSHSLSFFGVEGWTLLDFVLPVVFGLYAIILIMQKRLSHSLSNLSPIPLAILFLVSMHILTDPRSNEIIQALLATSIPIGGFRIYYCIFISMLLYYTVPLVIQEKKSFHKFLKIYLALVLFQIFFTYLRLAFSINHVPWDSHASQLRAFHPGSYWGGGIRIILLGGMGLHLFLFALILMRPGRWRSALIGLSILSAYVSKGRAPLFAIILVFLLYLIMRKKRLFLAIGVSMAVIAVLVFFRHNPSILNKLPPEPKRILSIFSAETPDYLTGTYTRMDMWKIQSGIILRNPLWGSLNEFPQIVDPRAVSAVRRGDTHGVYLGMAAIFGIPMLFLWLIFVAGRMKRLYLIWAHSREDSEIHQVSFWLLLLLVAYLFTYLATGGAGGGYSDAYVLFALADVTFKRYIRTKKPVLPNFRPM